MMETQMFINILLMLVAFFGGWFIRDIKKTSDINSERLRQIELLVTGKYITKDEFDQKMTAMFAKLDKIQEGVTECRINSKPHHEGDGC